LQLDFLQGKAKAFVLALFFCLTPLYLAEQNSYAAWCLVPILFSGVTHINRYVFKALWVILVVAPIYFGSLLLVLVSTTYIFMVFGRRLSTLFLLASLISPFIYQQWLVNFSSNALTLFSLSIGSAAFFICQLFSVVILFIALKVYKQAIFALITALPIWFLLNVLAFGGWLAPSIFTNELFRLLPGLVLLCTLFVAVPLRVSFPIEQSAHNEGKKLTLIFLIFFGLISIGGLSTKHNISQIIFDEAHGEWETTKTPYGPDDFGRNVTYTYSVLYEYANKIFTGVSRYEGGELPKDAGGSLFILKMPIEPLTDEFVENISLWVESGGHLLVVADHTNLFDTTTNLTPVLKRLGGIELASNANFNKVGSPTIASQSKFDFVLGKIMGVMSPFPYMTGTGFKYIPPTALTIGEYGPSFVEDAVYFRANRFGYFNPGLNFAYGNHPSAVLLGQKKGLVTVIGDSTPWSNFAIFHGEYFDLFRSIVAINAYATIYQFFSIAVIGLALSLILVSISSSIIPQLLGVIFCAIYIGVSAIIGIAGLSYPVSDRDYSLSVTLGNGARAENLAQLVPIGEHNFTRAISTFPKYGVIPRLQVDSGPSLNVSVPITLLINPNISSLPNLSEVTQYLQAGGRLNILFDKSQAKDAAVNNWLKSLSMKLAVVKSLSIQEGGRSTIEDRAGIELNKVIGYKVETLPTSHFTEVGSQEFFQAFRLQDHEPNKQIVDGHLVISFNSESISDAAMGEVWEGTMPSTLSKVREKQIAMLATSVFPKQIEVINDQRRVFSKSLNVPLRKFVVVKNGTKIIDGDIDLSLGSGSIDSLGDNPDFYLAKLESDSIDFIENNCQKLDLNNYCLKHFISHDLIEWAITYSKVNGRLVAIELVHDRRFSGLATNYNIVFLSK
jgi:hypothetical protein